MKKTLLFPALLLLIIIAACEPAPPASQYDWCYTYNFAADDYDINLDVGEWEAGTGFYTNDDGDLIFNWTHPYTVQPALVIATLETFHPNTSIQVAADVFGIPVTAEGMIEIFADPFEVSQSAESAVSGTAVNVTINTNRVVTIQALEIRGFGVSPFPTNGCGSVVGPGTPDGSLTPTPEITWQCEFVAESIGGPGFPDTLVEWMDGDVYNATLDLEDNDKQIVEVEATYYRAAYEDEYTGDPAPVAMWLSGSLFMIDLVQDDGDHTWDILPPLQELDDPTYTPTPFRPPTPNPRLTLTGLYDDVQQINIEIPFGELRRLTISGTGTDPLNDCELTSPPTNTPTSPATATATLTPTPTPTIPPTPETDWCYTTDFTDTQGLWTLRNACSGLCGVYVASTGFRTRVWTGTISELQLDISFSDADITNVGVYYSIPTGLNGNKFVITWDPAFTSERESEALTGAAGTHAEFPIFSTSNDVDGVRIVLNDNASRVGTVTSATIWGNGTNPFPENSCAPTPTPTYTPSPTSTAGPSATSTRTPFPTITLTPSRTFTATRTPTRTPVIVATSTRTNTPAPTSIPATATVTATRTASNTPPPTFTPAPTQIPPDDSGGEGTGWEDCEDEVTVASLWDLGYFVEQYWSCSIVPYLANTLNAITSGFAWIGATLSNFFGWIGSWFAWGMGTLTNLGIQLGNIWQLILSLLMFALNLLRSLWQIFLLLVAIAIHLYTLITGWIDQAFRIVSDIITAWQNAAPTPIPYLPQCVSQPMESGICAFYYVANNTLLSGDLGALIIPLLVLIFDMVMVFYFIRFVKNMVKKSENVV